MFDVIAAGSRRTSSTERAAVATRTIASCQYDCARNMLAGARRESRSLCCTIRSRVDSPMDKMLLSLAGFSAETERDKARQRTKDAMVRKALLGHVTGGRVYGYDNVPIVVPGPDGRPVRQGVAREINETQAQAGRPSNVQALRTGPRADPHR